VGREAHATTRPSRVLFLVGPALPEPSTPLGRRLWCIRAAVNQEYGQTAHHLAQHLRAFDVS
jgi:hypothetical protein